MASQSDDHDQNGQRYRDDEFPRKVLKELNNLRLSALLCDVTIIVENKEFNANKSVLSACSPYFRRMFANNFAESEERTVTLLEVDKESVESIFNFFYTSKVTIRDSNVQALLATATFLQVPEIRDRCCEYIEQQLDAANCLGIRDIADKYSCIDLKHSATAYTLDLFEEVIQHEEFLQLTLPQLIEIISADELRVTSEEKVYEAVLKWVNHTSKTEPDRTIHLPDLMTYVRLSQMDPHYLVGVSNEPLIRAHERCREYVDQAKNYLLLPDAREDMRESRFMPRKKRPSTERLYAVGGWVSGDAISSVEKYDPETNEWFVVSEMRKPRCGVGISVLNNVLYAVGGHDGCVYLSCIETYHPQTGKWMTDVAPLRSSRTSVGVATLNGYLYAIGGQEGPTSLDLVDKYSPEKNAWTKCAPLGCKRLGAGVAVLDNYIYAVGGADKNSSLNTVERYDPRTDQWQSVAPMFTKRKHLGCTAYDGFIYAIGGRDDSHELETAERYDPREDAWETIPSMSVRRSGVGSCVIKGLIYAVGGFDGSQYLRTVEVYDPVKKVWCPRAPMSFRRLGGGVAVMN